MNNTQRDAIRHINEQYRRASLIEQQRFHLGDRFVSRDEYLTYLDNRRAQLVDAGSQGVETYHAPASAELIDGLLGDRAPFVLLSDPAPINKRPPRPEDMLYLTCVARGEYYACVITHVVTSENSQGTLTAGSTACSIEMLLFGSVPCQES